MSRISATVSRQQSFLKILRLVAIVLFVVLVYLLGRRKGKKGGAQLEIYRLS